jgi:hypothetical protein
MNLGNVEEEDFEVELPTVKEEPNLRRLDDGPSSTAWRGNSRMGAGSCAISNDGYGYSDIRLIDLFSNCSVYQTLGRLKDLGQ